MDFDQSEVEDFLDVIKFTLQLLKLLSALDARHAIVVNVFLLDRPVSIDRFSPLHLQDLQLILPSQLLIFELIVANLGLV